MSISDILSDIKEDIAIEEIVVSIPQEFKFKLNISSIDKNVISKFNSLYNALCVKNTIKGMDKLDLNIAQEVFTMLPDMNKSDNAKLTTYPSVINKDIVETALKDIDNKIPQDVIQMVNSLAIEVKSNIDFINEVVDFFSELNKELKIKDEYLSSKKPMIIYNGTGKNLYTDEINDLIFIDDSTIDYEKYKGQLTNKYKNLLSDETFNKYIEYCKEENYGSITITEKLSLSGLVQELIHLNDIVRNVTNELFKYTEEAKNFNSDSSITIDNDSASIVNEVDSKMKTLKFLQTLHNIIETKDNFVSKLEELLNFIIDNT